MALTRQQLVELAQAGAQGENPYVTGNLRANLMKYLQGMKGEQASDLATQKSELSEQGKQADINRVETQAQAHPGLPVKAGSASIGKPSTTGVTGEAGAIKSTLAAYQKGLPDIQKRLSAAQEGFDLVNDPNNI